MRENLNTLVIPANSGAFDGGFVPSFHFLSEKQYHGGLKAWMHGMFDPSRAFTNFGLECQCMSAKS